MSLFRVDVERHLTATFYIEADSRLEAEEDADVLANEMPERDMNPSDTDYTISESESPEDGTWVWTGGENGREVTAESWKRKAA